MKYIVNFLLLLVKLLGTKVIIVPAEELFKVATTECNEAEKNYPHTSGEYKRHQVYARLIKKFPDVSKRALGFAIESTLNVHS